MSAPISMAWVPEPNQVGVEAGEFVEQNPHPLRALRDFEFEQLLHRKAVTEVVRHWAEVVDAVGHRDYLLIELGLTRLLYAGVQIADVGDDL